MNRKFVLNLLYLIEFIILFLILWWCLLLLNIIYDSFLPASHTLSHQHTQDRPIRSQSCQKHENQYGSSIHIQYPIIGFRHQKLGACQLNQPNNQNVYSLTPSYSPKNSWTNYTASLLAINLTTQSKTSGSKANTASFATASTSKPSPKTLNTSINYTK